MATRRRVRRKNLVNSVSDMQRRISYIEKLPNKRTIANNGVTAGKVATAAITRGNVTFGVVKPISEKPAIGSATPQDYDNIYYNSSTGALTGIDDEGDEYDVSDPIAQDIANDALTSAGGRNRIFFQTTAPTNPVNGYSLVVGDTWFDTDNDYKLSKWDGSAWTDAPLGDAAFANISVTKLIAGNITAGQYIQAGTNNSARIILAPNSGTSGSYSWDAGLSIYSNATDKSFYADLSGNFYLGDPNLGGWKVNAVDDNNGGYSTISSYDGSLVFTSTNSSVIPVPTIQLNEYSVFAALGLLYIRDNGYYGSESDPVNVLRTNSVSEIIIGGSQSVGSSDLFPVAGASFVEPLGGAKMLRNMITVTTSNYSAGTSYSASEGDVLLVYTP